MIVSVPQQVSPEMNVGFCFSVDQNGLLETLNTFTSKAWQVSY